MKARIAVPIVTSIVVAFSWPWAESDASVVRHGSDVSIAIPAEAANGRDGASAHASSRPGFLQPEHGNDMVAAVHPQLKPDYPCQNLHVREPDCPSR
jgi:hypothetical protein